MASLLNTQINNTYVGLIKMTDNLGVDGTPRELTTGDGGSLPIEVATNRINFYDTVDFTAATVLGLPGGSAGLVNGTGTDSLQSDASLTTNPAQATQTNTIALGDNAQARAAGAISIGHDAGGLGTTNWGSIAIGNGANVTGFGAVAIGGGTNEVTGNSGIAIGDSAKAKADSVAIGRAALANTQNESVAIGAGCQSTNFTAFSIGVNTNNAAEDSVAVGSNIQMQSAGSFNIGLGQGFTIGSGNSANVVLGQVGTSVPAGTNDFVGIGRFSQPVADCYNSIQIGLVSSINNSHDAVVIGRGASATGASNSVAIGYNSAVTAANAVAIGQVTHNRSNFAGVQELEVHTVGGGIIMPSPDGTLYKLTIANGGTVSIAAV